MKGNKIHTGVRNINDNPCTLETETTVVTIQLLSEEQTKQRKLNNNAESNQNDIVD